jgi:hypothetical protein
METVGTDSVLKLNLDRSYNFFLAQVNVDGTRNVIAGFAFPSDAYILFNRLNEIYPSIPFILYDSEGELCT